MITIHVRLHGILRDKLPAEDKGRTTLSLPHGSTVAAVLEQFSLRRRVEVAINEEIVDNRDTPLQDGDRLEFFRAAAGGSENRIMVDQFYCCIVNGKTTKLSNHQTDQRRRQCLLDTTEKYCTSI